MVSGRWKLRRSCVYCNHCLPCPSEIEIDSLMKLLDVAEYNLNEKVTADYEALTKRASDCTQCGVCIERCPFDVPVLDRMERAIEVFGCQIRRSSIRTQNLELCVGAISSNYAFVAPLGFAPEIV